MPKRIVIAGAGGFGREVLGLLDRDQFTPVGFVDPDPRRNVDLPLPILGNDEFLREIRERGMASCVCVAIGNPARRKAVFRFAEECGMEIPPVVHHSAVIFSSSVLSAGVIVFPLAVITANCRIGRGVLINTGATIAHDDEIGDFANIGPGAHLAGYVKIGSEAIVGIGATFREHVSVGDRAVVGAGSLVLDDIEAGLTAFGIPAKPRARSSGPAGVNP